jgi:hypothetical protein
MDDHRAGGDHLHLATDDIGVIERRKPEERS